MFLCESIQGVQAILSKGVQGKSEKYHVEHTRFLSISNLQKK